MTVGIDLWNSHYEVRSIFLFLLICFIIFYLISLSCSLEYARELEETERCQ